MGLQDCFQVAARLVVHQPDNLRLCHGLPVFQGPGENHGKRYWHAWAEVTHLVSLPVCNERGEIVGRTEPFQMTLVLDQSNGKDVSLPLEVFYRMGEITEDQVWRYTPDEAAELMQTTGHFGPWIEGHEQLGI